MQNSKLTIQKREFISYKLLNSFFGGIAMGTVFTIYGELNPSVFSIGGIALAIGLLVVAKLYTKIINIEYFYKISMAVEAVMLFAVIYFLLFPYNYTTALLVYIGYQFTFVFGGYLIRAETVFLSRAKILSFLDVAKQKGYLAGMFFAYVFYKGLEYLDITSNQEHVYNIHFFLLVIQIGIIYILQKSFKKSI
ncbi:MAG: hypothetical protein M0P43_00705 [Arcobacteraceae bacterium]|nr:hypothetical protein [Arcobacteraceae bacterium]MDY0326623.1 hypothetical protein [Arcobacteraceae bacterium]